MSIHRALVWSLTGLSILAAGLFAGAGWVSVAEAQLVAPFIPLSEDFEDANIDPLQLKGEPPPQLTMQGAIGGLQSLLIFPADECTPDECPDDWDEPTDTGEPDLNRSIAGSFDLSEVYLEEATGFALVRWVNKPNVTVAAVRLRLKSGVTEISTVLGIRQGASVQSAWHPLPEAATTGPIQLELSSTASLYGVGGGLRLDLRLLDGTSLLAIKLLSLHHAIRKVDRIEIGFRQAFGGQILGGFLVDDLVIRRTP